MSGGFLKALRSDSYVKLSQYRDQHFWLHLGSSKILSCRISTVFPEWVTMKNRKNY
uniref:Uncharacterized protein n=1 Tax=Balaenoptera musculus TaxID=9771 RepID=A0A8C0C6N6_BALMU